jgi:hypothetical protein
VAAEAVEEEAEAVAVDSDRAYRLRLCWSCPLKSEPTFRLDRVAD